VRAARELEKTHKKETLRKKQERIQTKERRGRTNKRRAPTYQVVPKSEKRVTKNKNHPG
jgi:hypothetical protein